ncbi:MAG: hypothetical protein ABIZ04_01390 [Opitutus sp.]
MTFGGLFFSDAPGQNWTNATTFQFLEAQGHRFGDFDILGNFVPNPVPGILRIADTSVPGYLNQGSQSGNYNFDITSIAFTITPNSFLAQGMGIANLTGFDPTFVTWSISAAPSSLGEISTSPTVSLSQRVLPFPISARLGLSYWVRFACSPTCADESPRDRCAKARPVRSRSSLYPDSYSVGLTALSF